MEVAHYTTPKSRLPPQSNHRRPTPRKMLRRYDSVHELPLHHHGDRPRAQSDVPPLQVLERAVRKELETIDGREELFLRGSSELSTLLRTIANEHGRSYFRYILRDAFGERSALYSNGRGTTAEAALYAQSIVQRMVRAIHYAPLVLRACTQYVLEQFQRAFPQCKTSARIVVGSILFVRIICPAVIKPEAFGFRPHTPKSLPMGVQIAKLLQGVLQGGLSSDPGAQPEAVGFITAFHPFVEAFLGRFPQLSDGVRSFHTRAEVTRFASWDETTSTHSPTGRTAYRGGFLSVSGDSSRLRGMSMSTHDDLGAPVERRKRKFSLKFW